MCSKRKMSRFTENYWDKIRILIEEIGNADAILIGAGAGLSVAAGFAYDGQRFLENFSDFEAKYHFHDMYRGGFYPYESPEEMWAYWSRYIYVNRYLDAPIPVYEQLYRIIKEMDYFVLTTNVDHCFQKAGFDKGRLFYTQGDYGLFQCEKPCCKETYDNKIQIYQMVEQQKEMKIPTSLIPKCPRCGGAMSMNLRSDDKFVQDKGWYRAADRYEQFIQCHQDKKVVYLELGVGYNTPAIIKYNFWNQVVRNEKAVYACLNMAEAVAPTEIHERSICITQDLAITIEYMAEQREVGSVS